MVLGLVAFAMFAIGIAVGLELLPWFSSRSSWEKLVGGSPGPSEETGPPPKIADAAGGEKLTYADLLKLFSSEADNPAIKRFVRSFLSDPEFRKIWEDFKRSDDIERLVKDLRRDANFLRLLRRYGGDPEFQRSVERLANKRSLAMLFGKVNTPERLARDEPVIREAVMGPDRRGSLTLGVPERGTRRTRTPDGRDGIHTYVGHRGRPDDRRALGELKHTSKKYKVEREEKERLKTYDMAEFEDVEGEKRLAPGQTEGGESWRPFVNADGTINWDAVRAAQQSSGGGGRKKMKVGVVSVGR